MAKIIKIGNSQGIRIPKSIVLLSNLLDKELDFTVLEDGLLITTNKKARLGWREGANKKELTAIWEWKNKY